MTVRGVREHGLQLVERRLHPRAARAARVGEDDAQRVTGTGRQRRAGRDVPEQGLGFLQRAGALGLQSPEQQHPFLEAGGRGPGVGVRGEERRDQKLLVEPLLRGEQPVDRGTLVGTWRGGGGAQGADRGGIEVRGLERLTEGERLRR